MFLFSRNEQVKTKEWFGDRIREYQPNLYGLAMTMMKNPEDASDAVQNAVLIAYSQLDSLRDPDRFKSWILQILVNECRKMLRSRKNFDEDEDALVNVPAQSDDSLSLETKLTLQDAVASLEEPYRTVIRLFYYEEMPVKEIAVITGGSSAAVRKQLQRGRDMLKTVLEEGEMG